MRGHPCRRETRKALKKQGVGRRISIRDVDDVLLWSIEAFVTLPKRACPKLEPISELLQEHGDRCKLHKPEEAGGVILSAYEEPPLP